MKIEISHDLLARKVYERASADDKMRLKVSTFIRARYADYKERKILLITADLNYIEPYEADLPHIFAHEPDILAFISKSKRRKRNWRIAIAVSLAAFILLGFVVTSVIFYYWRSAETGWQAAIISNNKLQDTVRELNIERVRRARVLDSLGISKEQLTSREEALLHVRDSLNQSMKSLKKAYEELEEAKRKIEEQSKKQLAEANSKASKLENDKKKIEEEKNNAQRTNQQIASDYAAELARQAAEQLKIGKKDQAFRLAAQSFDLAPTNQAQEVLKKIHTSETPDFNLRDLPAKNIIQRYANKYNYKPRLKR